jgi:hypothetical protein
MNRVVYILALASVALLLLSLYMGLMVSEGSMQAETHMAVALVAVLLSVITHFLSLRFF